MLSRKCEIFGHSDLTSNLIQNPNQIRLKKHSFLKFTTVFKQEAVINLLKQDVQKGFTVFKPRLSRCHDTKDVTASKTTDNSAQLIDSLGAKHPPVIMPTCVQKQFCDNFPWIIDLTDRQTTLQIFRYSRFIENKFKQR